MKFEGNTLKIGGELSNLDQKVLDFIEIITEAEIDYVIVSGYVAILTGRSRGTEDIDVILEELNPGETDQIVEKLTENGYWCINSGKDEIYSMLEDDLAVRFAEKDEVIPNFETRFARDEFERTALKERIKVEINSNTLYISPLELQIAYKLHLGTEKDFEDALHLYKSFEDRINPGELDRYAEKLEVKVKLDELRKT